MYATRGPARRVPPEALLKATVLMAMYSIRSERAFCERLNYDLLFKWFLDLRIDEPAFDATTFTKNRQRLLDHEVADEFFAAVVRQAKLRRYISSDHFSVDGTLLEAWASHKSFKPKDGPADRTRPAGRNAEVGWHGEKRSNETHASTTDPEARLSRKSNDTAAKMCYSGHLLMENRNALIVDAELTPPTGYAERDTAVEMLGRLPRADGVAPSPPTRATTPPTSSPRSATLGFTPHVAQNTTNRRSAIDGRTTRHAGHVVSQRIRKRVEEPFGWIKTIGGGRKLRYIGRERNRAWFKIDTAVYNLIRITALDAQHRPDRPPGALRHLPTGERPRRTPSSRSAEPHDRVNA